MFRHLSTLKKVEAYLLVDTIAYTVAEVGIPIVDLSLAFSQYRWNFLFLIHWEDGTQRFYPLKVLSFEVERCP